MQALSIRQPWAWLICAGLKDVENRTWPTKFRGRIYIHTGQSRSDMDKATLASILRQLSNRDATRLMLAYGTLPFGAVIGEADVVDCRFRFGEENGNLYSEWAVRGQYGFTLSNSELYKTPIPCSGKLGFFAPELLKGE